MNDWVDDLPHDAPGLKRMVEQREQRAYDEGRTEVMDVMTEKVAQAWDEGYRRGLADSGPYQYAETPNPHRGEKP